MSSGQACTTQLLRTHLCCRPLTGGWGGLLHVNNNDLDCFWKEPAGIQEPLLLAAQDGNHALLFLLSLK